MPSITALDTALAGACSGGHIAGLVAMAASGSHILYQGAFGRRRIDQPEAMTADSLFWVASMTKAVTSVAAMQLVERGILSLDGPLGALVPQLENPQVLEGFDAAGAPVTRPAKTPVTLRHLLTHTSGLTYDMWDGNLKLWLAKTATPAMGSGRVAALNFPLASDPGTRWAYGTGIDFVGRAVEAASGRRLDGYFRDEILAPLGMFDTSFVPTAAQKPRIVAMHRRQPDGTLATIPFGLNPEPEFFSGGGGLYSTAPDYIRFVQMILGKGGRLLKPETVALMSANQIGELDVQKMASAIPTATNDVEFWPGMAKKWGFGFLINTQAVPAGRSAGSLAWAGLSNCYYWIDPERDIAGVILMQVLPFYDQDCRAAAWALEQGVYAAHGSAGLPAR